MKTGVHYVGNQIILVCQGCKKQYDLKKAVVRSENKREKDVRCPNCGEVVARI